MQLACRASDKVHIERQVHAYFPEVAIAVAENVLREIWGAAGSAERVVVDFGLSEEFMLPIRTFSGFDPDPLIAAAGALADVREGEVALLQVLFQEAREPWAESVFRAVTDRRRQ